MEACDIPVSTFLPFLKSQWKNPAPNTGGQGVVTFQLTFCLNEERIHNKYY